MQKRGEREREKDRGEGIIVSPGRDRECTMIGCIPRERGLEERVDRGGEAFNTCGTVLPLSIKRIGWITISTPCREKERKGKRNKRSPLRLPKKNPPADPAIARYPIRSAVSRFSKRDYYLVALSLITEIKKFNMKKLKVKTRIKKKTLPS